MLIAPSLVSVHQMNEPTDPVEPSTLSSSASGFVDSSTLDAIHIDEPRLRPSPRSATFRHARGPNSERFRFVRPCRFPFLNKNFLKCLWQTDSLLVVLDSQTNVNLVLAPHLDSHRFSQSGLSLGSAIGLIELARPSIVHLKVNMMSTISMKQFAELGLFLRDAKWIRDVRVNVPNMLVRGVYALLDLVAEKIVVYHGPTCYLPQLQDRAPLQTIVNTPMFRPGNWFKTRTSPAPADECITNTFRAQAPKLRFEISGLFETLWKHEPLPFNSTVESIRITDSAMMSKQRLRFPCTLPRDVAANCRRTLRVLKSAIRPECEVVFTHRGWCGFPAVQSFTRLIAELVSLVQRARGLILLAREAGVERFVSAIEMDVVLRRNDFKRPLLSPALVLRSLERVFRCTFEVFRDARTQQPKPDFYVANLEENSVFVVLDFRHVICAV